MKAFVYTELQISKPFKEIPWDKFNPLYKKQPGLISKTYLAGVDNHSVGGIYAFDTIENAKKFALVYFPAEAASLNAAFTTRVFDATVVEEASKDMNSPFYK